MDERSRSNKLRYVFLYFGDDMILKVCDKFSVYLDVNMVYKEMILTMKPFSGYVLLYIYINEFS